MRRGGNDARIHRRGGPGDHQHALHGLRSRRQRGGQAPARARADPPAARLGRARPNGDLGAHQHGDAGSAAQRRTCPRRDLAAIGITNQRETTVVWDPRTGRPYYNAIVWQDTRTDRIVGALERDGDGDDHPPQAGCRPATYFSGGKIHWMLDNVDGLREAAEAGDALFGTIGHVGDLESDRRPRRRRARHRRHQRQPHHADEPGDAGLGRRTAGHLRRPARDAADASARRPIRRRYGATRTHGRSSGRSPDHRRPRRPAGGDRRPGLLRPRRSQEHLRHRQLPAAQHRHGARAFASTVC